MSSQVGRLAQPYIVFVNGGLDRAKMIDELRGLAQKSNKQLQILINQTLENGSGHPQIIAQTLQAGQRAVLVKKLAVALVRELTVRPDAKLEDILRRMESTHLIRPEKSDDEANSRFYIFLDALQFFGDYCGLSER